MDVEERLTRLRREFYAHRNGILADTLRSAGDPHQFVMGCPLAELATIAATETPDAALATALWADSKHRECRLTAPMLMPIDALTLDEAMRWATEVITHEEADVLCHRLLRRTPFADSLVSRLMTDPQPMSRYVARRLMLNLTVTGRRTLSDTERNDITHELATTTSPPMRQVLTALLED